MIDAPLIPNVGSSWPGAAMDVPLNSRHANAAQTLATKRLRQSAGRRKCRKSKGMLGAPGRSEGLNQCIQALAMTKRLFVESVIRLGCAVASGESRSESSCPAPQRSAGASLFSAEARTSDSRGQGRQATPCVDSIQVRICCALRAFGCAVFTAPAVSASPVSPSIARRISKPSVIASD